MEKVVVIASEYVSYSSGLPGTLAKALAIRSFITRLSTQTLQELTSGFSLSATEIGNGQLLLTIEVRQTEAEPITQER
jgi:hypothetical protein